MMQIGEVTGAKRYKPTLLRCGPPSLVVHDGLRKYEAGEPCVQTHGGFGFVTEYDVERKFRESRLYLVAPTSTNMILSHVAEHVPGLSRSY